MCLLMIAVGEAYAATWLVFPDGSGDATTIQDGINVAASGDTVMLAAGTFSGAGNRGVSFQGKAVTVTSVVGAAGTVIDCGGADRGFVFASGEGSSSALSRVTITDGDPLDGSGGAVLVGPGCSPTIAGVIMVGNNAATIGGAIHCQAGSSPLITGCVFENNTAPSGGGIGSSGAAPTIDGNTFTSNRGGDFAGAIICSQVSAPTISDNTFSGNRCRAGPGGAVFCLNASPTIEKNVFFANSAGTSGGAIACSGAQSSPVIRCNTISENSALVWGGGIYATDANPVVEHTIIVFSTSGPGIGCAGIAAPVVSCCDIFGNAGGDALCGVDGGWNISADPQFCGVAGTGDFRLQSDSPCAPAHSGCGDYIGAVEIGCGTVDVRATTWGGVKARYR